jgi:hypothetical protein
MRFEEFLKSILTVLQAAGVDYMLGGAVAVWPWGEPRTTQDIDLVILLKPESVNLLSEELEKIGIFLPPKAILDNLLETRTDLPINAIHGASGFKAEMFIFREGDELRKSAFERRKKVDMGGEIGEVYLYSPEDLVVYKLIYYSLGRQTKHIRDIGSILKVLGEEIDVGYIHAWAEKKGVASIWEEIRDSLAGE